MKGRCKTNLLERQQCVLFHKGVEPDTFLTEMVWVMQLDKVNYGGVGKNAELCGSRSPRRVAHDIEMSANPLKICEICIEKFGHSKYSAYFCDVGDSVPNGIDTDKT